MSRQLDAFINALDRFWTRATPEDFGAMALAIVCFAWFFTRFNGYR